MKPVHVITNFLEEYDLHLDSSKPPTVSTRPMPKPPEDGYALYRAAARPSGGAGGCVDRNEFLGPPRPVQFEIATLLGMPTVEHGLAKDLWAAHVARNGRRDQAVVAYEHLQAHGGNGKRLCLLRDLASSYPDTYCSMYESRSLGRCERIVQLGKRAWSWQVQGEAGEWAASRADEISLPALAEDTSELCEGLAPVWGFDLVLSEHRGLVVCDVNFAPGVRGLGLNAVTTPEAIAGDVRAWFDQYQRSPNWCTNWEHELALLKDRAALAAKPAWR